VVDVHPGCWCLFKPNWDRRIDFNGPFRPSVGTLSPKREGCWPLHRDPQVLVPPVFGGVGRGVQTAWTKALTSYVPGCGRGGDILTLSRRLRASRSAPVFHSGPSEGGFQVGPKPPNPLTPPAGVGGSARGAGFHSLDGQVVFSNTK